MRHSTVLLFVSTAVLTLIFTGCDSQSRHQQVEPVSARAAIGADCVAHYFKSNASAYITSQQHGFNPQTGFFQAASTEPVGTVECTLTQDVFSSSGPKGELLSDVPVSFWDKNLATVLFYGFCAGGDLLDAGALTPGENIKVQGQWYKSFKPGWPVDVEVMALQSLDSSRVELVELIDAQNGLWWLVQCYNYRFSKELKTQVPRTIDVYDVRNGIASKELMVRFDYKAIRKIVSPQETD